MLYAFAQWVGKDFHFMYQLGNGNAFLFSAALLIFASVLSSLWWARLPKALASWLSAVSLALLLLAATPLPKWYFVLWCGPALLVVVFNPEFINRKPLPAMLLRALVVGLSMVAILLELPYRHDPVLPRRAYKQLYIVGDSISAGLNEGETTWSRLLHQEHGVEVTNFAQAGATVESALKQAQHVPPDANLVLLEIGGNDLLGGAPAAQFREDLQHMLELICTPSRTVVMFELPLLPFCSGYGQAQRQLAAAHGVLLIPKYHFTTVLSGDHATVDGLHLSREGAEKMAAIVWNILQPAWK